MNFSTEKNGLIDNGIYCCVLKERTWNSVDMTLCIYYSGRFYDIQVVDDEVPFYANDITEIVKMHSFTGKTYEINKS